MSVLGFSVIFFVREVTSEEEEGPATEQDGLLAWEDKEKEDDSK